MSQFVPSKHSNQWHWQSTMADDLRAPFQGADTLAANYAQGWQDIFVLSTLGGRREGRYMEIGGNHPVSNNNTYLLHQFYGWSGVTLEFDPAHFPAWLRDRPESMLVMMDALVIDYSQALPLWFGGHDRRIDYLQLDIDPSINTLAVLKRLPLDAYRFSVITFETDAYLNDFRARDESREILQGHGYELVARDISVPFNSVVPVPFEDWWVDPQIIGRDKIDELQAIDIHTNMPQDILFCG